MSKRIPLLLAVFLCITALPSPANADPDFTFTVPVKITNLPKGYSPWVFCRVKEYTKSSPNMRLETAKASQTVVPDANGNFDGEIKLDLSRFGYTPAANPDSVYSCDLNFIYNKSSAVPPNSAAKLQVFGGIP